MKKERGPYPSSLRYRLSGMVPDETTFPAELRSSWQRFLESYEPLRPELYRYCRHLARSPWDAEDLAQDAMARAFVTLGRMGTPPEHPKAWLFRIASNLWIDEVRRRREVLREDAGADAEAKSEDARGTREAAGTLIGRLSPQERAAVVLKDAFDFSVPEISETLATTENAVKAALHRGREKLVEPDEEKTHSPPPAVLDAFCAAFNRRDLDALTSLLLDTAQVDVVGVTTMYGPEAAKTTVLWGMLFGTERLANGEGVEPRFVRGALPAAPRVELRRHRGEWLLVHFYAHDDGEAVRAVTRIDVSGDKIAHLKNYFFDPDFLVDVCGELGVPCRVNGYRFFLGRDCRGG